MLDDEGVVSIMEEGVELEDPMGASSHRKLVEAKVYLAVTTKSSTNRLMPPAGPSA